MLAKVSLLPPRFNPRTMSVQPKLLVLLVLVLLVLPSRWWNQRRQPTRHK